MKIAIVGGGISGLTAAHELAGKGHRVYVFEKEKTPGGLAGSFTKENWDWPLEKYYHHFFKSDSAVNGLANKLKIEDKIFFSKPKTSIFRENNIFLFNGPLDLLRLPFLNIKDKMQLGITSVFLKINPFWKPLENISAEKMIKTLMGEKVFTAIWQPLLKGKFASQSKNISATWFWTRINKRSSSLGYFNGGFDFLIKSLILQISSHGGVFFFEKEVSQIKKQGSLFSLLFKDWQYGQKFDRVLLTVSPSAFLKLTKDLSVNKNVVKNLKSIGSVCLILELKKQFLKQTYWLNINDLDFPFVALVEHTNFINKKHYNNHNLLYLGGYYPTNHPFFKTKKEELLEIYLPYLNKINSKYEVLQNLVGLDLFRDQYTQPVPGFSYSKKQPSIKTGIDGLFWTSLHHVYPQDRGINYAILTGLKMAKLAEK